MGQSMSCGTRPEHGIFASVQCGDIVTVRRVMTSDPSLLHQTTPYDRHSVLHVAAASGQIEILTLLLERFENPDVLNRHKQTPLMLAAMYGRISCVKKLAEVGANVLMFDSVNRRTCLHYAAYYGHADCVQAILSAAQSSPVAVHWGYARFVNIRDDKGATPLHLAARQRRPGCVNVLLDSGSLVCANTSLYGSPGSTPLHLAARSGSIDCVRKLLAWGADRLQRDTSGRIPYVVAMKHKHGACGALLNPSSAEPLVWPSPLKFISELNDEAKLLLEQALMDANREREETILKGTAYSPSFSDTASGDNMSEMSDSELCCICFEQVCTIEVKDCGHQMCAQCTLALCCHNKPNPTTSTVTPPVCPFCRSVIVRLVVAQNNNNDKSKSQYEVVDHEAGDVNSSKLRKHRRSINLGEESSSFMGLSSIGSFGRITGRSSGRIAKMPMFQPLKRDGLVGFEGGGDGQVLDLDTAVKDGLLGGVNGGGGVVDEKIDLKTMIKELDLQDIPSVFICPISLEPMQDPVTLCTGQTYERSNIHKWFSLGHLTCPTTMQELWDDAVTPNRTLHHLIYTWFSQKYVLMKKRSEDVQGRAIEVLGTLKKAKGQARVHALSELKQIVVAHLMARKTVVEEGGVSVISSLLGPFTSHAVGSEVVAILVSLDLDSDSKSGLMQPAKVSLIVDMLNDGSNETKVNCVRLIRGLVEEKGFRPELVSSHSLLVGLIRLVKDKRHRNGVSPALGLLKPISAHKQVRSLMVRVGAVPQLVDILPSLDPDCLESALFVLDALCSDMEGRVAVKDSANTIPYTVKVLMRVTESCTNYALSILWSVCKLAPEECSPLAVEVGLAAKLLLVIQSGCDPALKQRSAELLKLCSLHYSDTMFISKCKLTRTIQ